MTEPTTSLPAWAFGQASHTLALLKAVADAVAKGEPADRALRATMGEQRKYGSRDRRLFGDAVFTWFRWVGVVGKLGPSASGLCAAWYLDARPWEPALLALMQDIKLTPPEVLPASMPLDERLAKGRELFGDTLAPPEDLLPAWLLAQTADWGDVSERLQAHLRRPPTWLRVDHAHREALHEALVADGARWAGDASPCAYGFHDAGKVHDWLHKHPEALEIQDISSQQVVRVAAPQAGETWWDACCGAGGKSLQLLDEAGGAMDLTCTDRREEVLKELTQRGRRHGRARVRRYALDLLQTPELPNLVFDGILVDAPCSGAGTWARSPDGPWRCTEKEVRQAARRQIVLLAAVAPGLRPGGRLVYAVCSHTRAETDQVVDAFLAAHPNFALDPLPHPLSGEATDGRVRVTADQGPGDHMFVARFRKKE